MYDTAGDDPAQIPWADLSSHPLLADWLTTAPAPAPNARALDVGCGLGDNAAALAAKGYPVNAFDLSPRAIAWAQSRFPDIAFSATDLFNPPADWISAFALVHECYTLQAIPDAPRYEAMGQIARFLSPGGTLVVIARSRETAGLTSGPPWPLTRDEVMRFTTHGLRNEALDALTDPSDGKPHWRAVFRRA